ncbi:LysR family transcriptional regulator [Actinopolymorpha alba]|uniref:LysR family transcriptional regulator n=1 Tax=Actinopolymorpha alba TaxID=533267 RepID=UPI000373E00F|nr:LysR family transcriptional regulator [Actinopolymorpha alba]
MPLSSSVPDLGALDLLLSVARLGSIGQAAHEHGISQPAASLRIRNLERLLGIELVERTPRGSRLTQPGTMVASWARDVIDAASALDEGVRALRAGLLARIRVAASLTVAEYLLPGWLTTLRGYSPDLALSLHVANSVEVGHMVLDGRADIGFVEGLGVPRGLRSRQIMTDHLVVVVGRGHPWAGRSVPLTPENLAATPLILREVGSGTREILVRGLEMYAPTAAPVAELSSTTAIKAAVAAGAGPTVLSSLAVVDDITAGRLIEVPVNGLDLRRRLRVVWASGRDLPAPARNLIAIALQAGRASRVAVQRPLPGQPSLSRPKSTISAAEA